jgi:hypothetical protein
LIDLFGELPTQPSKTYRAIRHDVVRKRQRENCPSAHHPSNKILQIGRVLAGKADLKILELFAGAGNLTAEYNKFGTVTALDKKNGTGDSFREYHRLIADKEIYDIVDADPYGFPTRLMPDIFLLLDDGYLFLTIPMPSVNILHDITKTHLCAYFGNPCPTIDAMIERIALWGLCHWREVTEVETIKIDRMWRCVLRVSKIKATDYTGVRNR